MSTVRLEIRFIDLISERSMSHAMEIAWDKPITDDAERLAKEFWPLIDSAPADDLQQVRIELWRGHHGVHWDERDISTDKFFAGVKRLADQLEEWRLQWLKRWQTQREKYGAMRQAAEAKQ